MAAFSETSVNLVSVGSQIHHAIPLSIEELRALHGSGGSTKKLKN